MREIKAGELKRGDDIINIGKVSEVSPWDRGTLWVFVNGRISPYVYSVNETVYIHEGEKK